MLKNIYEKVLAGAFLKFEKLDNIDIHLFCKKILTKLSDENYWCYGCSSPNLFRFIKEEFDGTISLKEEFTLDSVIDYEYLLKGRKDYEKNIDEYYYEGITLKEIFERFCDEKIIKKYFDNLGINEYYKEKEEFLKKQKEKLLNNANILLISDDEEEYNNIKNFGFKKIDWFKSGVVADNYFKKNKKKLDKYHILIEGSHPYLDIGYQFKNELGKNENIFRSWYYKCTVNNGFVEHFSEDFTDELTHRSWQVLSPDYNDILNGIVTASIMKDVLGKMDKKYLNAKPIEINNNPNKLPLPNKKEDIKILYLRNYYNASDYANNIAKKLELNVDFKKDDNNGIKNYIAKCMGDYDIIIADNIYSSQILNFKKEALEQCKEKGRDLALFLTYENNETYYSDENGNLVFGKLGNELKLKYILIDKLSKDNDIKENNFCVINGNNPDKNIMKAIIESAVNFYNDELKKINNVGIKDINFKTFDEYDNEYNVVKANEDERINSILKPIRDINDMLSIVHNYLTYKKWLDEEDNNYKITLREDGLITIEEITYGKPVAILTLIDKYTDTFRDFIFSYEDENNSIKDKKRYGFYTSKHDDELFAPEKPDECTLKRLNEFEEKINEILRPLWYKARKIKWKNESKISEFDSMCKSVLDYLKYSEYDLIPVTFTNFKISSNASGVRVALMQGKRCIAALTFKNNYGDNSRVFMIEQIGKNGFLSKPQMISYVAGYSSNIKQPDDKELIIINKVKEIINNQITLFNRKAAPLYKDLELGSFDNGFGSKIYRNKNENNC